MIFPSPLPGSFILNISVGRSFWCVQRDSSGVSSDHFAVAEPVHVGLVEVGGAVLLKQMFGDEVFNCVVNKQSLELNVVF